MRCTTDGKTYVVKVQLKAKIRGRNVALFRRMTERMMNLPDSPNVIKVFACYEDEKYFYTLLESLRGGDLVDFVENKTLASDSLKPEVVERDVRNIIGSLLESLHHLHNQGLIHKDVKLENFVFKEKGDIVESVGSFFSCCSGDSSKVSRALFVTLGVVGRYQEILIGSFSSVPRLIFCK